MDESIRVFVCEDDPVFARLLLNRLGQESGFAVVGWAVSKEPLMAALQSVSFDVLLLDLNLSKTMEGLEIALELRGKEMDGPGAEKSPKIIVLSSMEDDEIIVHTLGFGRVDNYITKEHFDDIPAAIRDAYHGRSGLHHSTAAKVLNVLSNQQESDLRKRITPTQIKILQLQDAGYSRREISEMLFYSEYTINNELCKVSSVLKGKFPYLEWLRLKKHNSKEIIQLAKQLGIL
ncbi:response regulator, partial [Gorillibacterium massiliense]|uniref:response regulator n=1 Tax=Gorillibacterium massiliense TaxID=1280390 RepID=UPI00059308D7